MVTRKKGNSTIMTGIKKFFIGLLSCALCANDAIAKDCNNDIYRLQNPKECTETSESFKLSFSDTIGITSGALALVSGAIALLTNDSHNETISTTTATRTPTLPKYDMVGSDIDEVHLASILSDTEYLSNSNQYNDIRVAYSLARGFSGNGSEIAVFDSGKNTIHGGNVAHFASGYIAPNASVSSYMVADRYGDFKSFYEIGNEINSATSKNTNIYNFSWSANISATDIRTRHQLISSTDTNFINSLIDAAHQNDAIFVWAAGNDGMTQSSALSAIPLHINELQGHFVNVVAWDSETGALANFSNACGITKDYCITAPGTNLESPLSTNPLHGTSFAAPIVSAGIAVIRQAFPYMKSSEITNLLFTTARDLGDTGVDEIYGHGMLDLERATRPVGTPLIPISEQFSLTMRAAHISAPIGHKLQSKNLKFAFIDDFGRAFTTNMNDNISIKNRSIGQEHLRDPNTLDNMPNGIEFGIKQTDLLNGDGFLQTAQNNIISFIRHSGQISLGNTEFFHQTSFGISTPNNTPESMISGFSNIYTASILVGAKHGDFALSIGTPDTIISGNMYLRTLSGRANNGDYIFTNNKIDLTSVPSIEYRATYKSLSAGFVDNPSGRNEIYILAKTKLSF